MNTEIKAGVDTVFSVVNLVIHMVQKKGTIVAVEDLTKIASDFKSVVQGWGNLGSEIKGLGSIDAEMDLMSYIQEKVTEVGGDSKYVDMVVSSLKLAGSLAIGTYGLVHSVQGLKSDKPVQIEAPASST